MVLYLGKAQAVQVDVVQSTMRERSRGFDKVEVCSRDAPLPLPAPRGDRMDDPAWPYHCRHLPLEALPAPARCTLAQYAQVATTRRQQLNTVDVWLRLLRS